jgi:hypothetical protein
MHVASVYFQVFRVFQTYVSSVLFDVAKVDLGVAYTCTLQEYVSSVLDISYVCCNVSSRYFMSFAMAIRCFASVSDVCCKYFSYFWMYVACVSTFI